MLPALTSLVELIYPAHCLNCKILGNDLCGGCAREWQLAPFIVTSTPIPIWSSARYSPKTSQIILAAKENNNRAARKILAASINKSLIEVMRGQVGKRVLLIPIPSSRKMNRKRGNLHTQLLAEEVKRIYGGPLNIAPLLFHNRSVRDQSQLPFSGRDGNMHGAYSVDLSTGQNSPNLEIFEAPEKCAVIIVDDLVTSGSSVREAVRALKSGAISPVAAISACAVSRAYGLR